jgi:hypothetical protein
MYIDYGQQSVGGKQLAEVVASIQDSADKLRNLMAWMQQIGAADPAQLETNPDFACAAGHGALLYNTMLEINGAMVDYMTANREKLERLSRGS